MGMDLALRSWLADNMAAGVFSRSRVRSESLHSASLSATSQLRSRTLPYAWLPFPFHSSTDLAIPRTSYSNTSAVARLVLLPTLFQFKHTYMQRRLWLHDLILPCVSNCSCNYSACGLCNFSLSVYVIWSGY